MPEAPQEPLTRAEIEAAEKRAESDWNRRWNRDQRLRDQYGGRFENFAANQRAQLRTDLLKRGMHTR